MSESRASERAFASSNALSERGGDPAIRLVHFAPHRDHVHDRKHARLAEVRFLPRAIVGEEPRHARVAGGEAARLARGEDHVDLAFEQHLVERALRLVPIANPGGQLELDLFRASRVVDAGLHPLDRFERHAELVSDIPARVDRRGLRPFRHADARARELVRASVRARRVRT